MIAFFSWKNLCTTVADLEVGKETYFSQMTTSASRACCWGRAAASGLLSIPSLVYKPHSISKIGQGQSVPQYSWPAVPEVEFPTYDWWIGRREPHSPQSFLLGIEPLQHGFREGDTCVGLYLLRYNVRACTMWRILVARTSLGDSISHN